VQQANFQRRIALLAAAACGALATLASPNAHGQSAAETGALSGTAPARAAGVRPRVGTGSAPAGTPGAARASTPALRPCTNVSVDPPMSLALGKSRIINLEFPASRIIVGGLPTSRAAQPVPSDQPGAAAGRPGAAAAAPARQGTTGVADTEITLLSPTELYFLGRTPGSMNVIIHGNDGRCVVKDIVVTMDPDSLQAKIAELMPEESGVKVRGADSSLVLTGTVSDSVRLNQVMTLAASFADAKRIVNMLRVTAPQQVMLEVKIAEVSKNLLDRLGSAIDLTRTTGSSTFSLITDFLTGSSGVVQALRKGRDAFVLDAQKNDGVVRVLAEPNIMAISGQPASFLSGGKIFIPVAQAPSGIGGFTTITLEEKEFGVGLKFTPTVLDGRVNLKVTSEVSELSQTGTPFTTLGGVTAVLPSLTTRRVDTTVQLGDGQSFVVAGLIKHNVTEAVNKFPGLGEAPVLGALFRSTEFQNDQTELMFVVTPRLVKPLTAMPIVPTDNHVVPTRNDVMLNGAGEGPPPQVAPGEAPNR
jgi:pilus assembly protein CpaC